MTSIELSAELAKQIRSLASTSRCERLGRMTVLLFEGPSRTEERRASQRRLAGVSFDAAGFGHGEPLVDDASTRFRSKWGNKYLPDRRASAFREALAFDRTRIVR